MGGGPQFPNEEVHDELVCRISQLGFQAHDEKTAALPNPVEKVAAILTPNDNDEIPERVDEQSLSMLYPRNQSESTRPPSTALPAISDHTAEDRELSQPLTAQDLYKPYDLTSPQDALQRQMYGDAYPRPDSTRIELHRQLLNRWAPKQQHPFDDYFSPYKSSSQTGYTSRPTPSGPYPLSQQSAPYASLQHDPLPSAYLGFPGIKPSLPLRQYSYLLTQQLYAPQATQSKKLPRYPHQSLPPHSTPASTATRATGPNNPSAGSKPAGSTHAGPSSPRARALSQYPPPMSDSPASTYFVQAEAMGGYDAQVLRRQFPPRRTAGNGAVTGGKIEVVHPQLPASNPSCGFLKYLASVDNATTAPSLSSTEAVTTEPEQSSGSEMSDTFDPALPQDEELGDLEKLIPGAEKMAAKTGYRTFEI